jgi:predicted outer membrane repeat protein
VDVVGLRPWEAAATQELAISTCTFMGNKAVVRGGAVSVTGGVRFASSGTQWTHNGVPHWATVDASSSDVTQVSR